MLLLLLGDRFVAAEDRNVRPAHSEVPTTSASVVPTSSTVSSSSPSRSEKVAGTEKVTAGETVASIEKRPSDAKNPAVEKTLAVDTIVLPTEKARIAERGISAEKTISAENTVTREPLESSKDPKSENPSKGPRVEELKPTLYYLPDKDGRLQAVLDFGYEDFLDLYKIKQQLEQKEQRPRFSIEKLLAQGKVEGDRAELAVRVRIALHGTDWVRIPLRMDRGLLTRPAEYQGSGEKIIEYLGANEGYVVWLRGPSESTHEFSFPLMAPIVTVGTEHRIRLPMPRATISELKLTVPEESVVVQGSEGVTVFPPTALTSGGTELSVGGMGSDFELSWRKTGESNTPSPAVLEVGGSILARLDDRSATSEAVLNLRSFGAPFDRFTVRLPEGSEWIPTNHSAYTLAPLEPKEGEKETARRVEVRLPKKTVGPVEVRLSCRRQLESNQWSSWLDLSGFEVLNAARQWGVLGVAVTGDWQVLWGSSRGVQQIDQLPENLRIPGLVAGFEYSLQPFTLQVRLNPRRTRINVEPEYLLFVDRDRVRLDAKLTYSIHGSKAHSLRISMPGWDLERLEPENLIAAEGIVSDEKGMLVIPLIEPTSGTFELRLKARQNLPADTSSIAIGLPQPEGTASVSAVVAVSPADNVELTPDNKSSVGLIRQQVPLPLKLPERRQEPLFYRSEGSEAVFAAGLSVHSRQVTVDVTDQIKIAEPSVQVEQILAYTIAFEAVDRLLVDVPQQLVGSASLQFERDGKPLVVKAIPPAPDAAVPSGMTRMGVELPEAHLGPCKITARFSLPLPAIQAVKPTQAAIPLIVPAEGEVTSNKLLLTTAAGLKAIPPEKSWQLAEKEAVLPGRVTPRPFRAEGHQSRLDLTLSRDETSGINATIIDRAWIQTWLTSSSKRQDRVVFQLLSNQNELSMTMPSGVVFSQIVALLDGKPVEVRPRGTDRLAIPLNSDSELHRYVLELRYHFSNAQPTQGRLKVDFPHITSGAWSRRLYWQLILPPNDHIIDDPRGFVSEYRWGFLGYYWGRQPRLNQEELETWVGVTHRAALPEGVNTYLFCALGTIEGGEVWTAGRAFIVLASSGSMLLLGLLFIYLPRLRHPATLLILAVGLFSMGLIFPELTILLAQTSSIGLILALLTALFIWLFPRRPLRKISERPVLKIDRPSAKTPRYMPVVPSPLSSPLSSTQSLPIIPEPEPPEE